MNNTIKFSVDSKNSGKRLDIFLSDNLNRFTRSFIKKLIENRGDELLKQIPQKKIFYILKNMLMK